MKNDFTVFKSLYMNQYDIWQHKAYENIRLPQKDDNYMVIRTYNYYNEKNPRKRKL